MKKLTPNRINESPPPAAPAESAPSGPAPNQTSDIPSSISDVAPSPSPEESFISREELARRLHKSIRTIAYWQRKGIIPFVKIGNSTWFNWPDIQTYLQKNFRVCPAPADRLLRIPVIAMLPRPKRKAKP